MPSKKAASRLTALVRLLSELLIELASPPVAPEPPPPVAPVSAPEPPATPPGHRGFLRSPWAWCCEDHAQEFERSRPARGAIVPVENVLDLTHALQRPRQP